jgi:hypothetical protein
MHREHAGGRVWLSVALCLVWLAAPAAAQLGGLSSKAKGAVQQKAKKVKKTGAEAGEQTTQTATSAAAVPAVVADQEPGGFVFATAPIDPNQPANLSQSFKAGDFVYGLVQIDKTWRELLARGDESATEVQVPFDMLVDGETVDFQYITIRKPEAIDSKLLVFDVAPEPDKMTAYMDPGFVYAEGKGYRKIGPDQYTYNLSRLAPGKHTIRFRVRSYGDVSAAGEFAIEGEDYKPYALLRDRLLARALEAAGMPQAQKIDRDLEATMRQLLTNAGWTNTRKLVIVDKDWWIDRASGGDSAIVSRHIAAAAAARAADGTFYWSVCTFHQQRRIDGSYGPLELTDVGAKKPILEANIGQ